MANQRKGCRPTRTMAQLIDTRRARTPAGALIELSAMANEKQLLNRELTRWKHRHAEIQTRLGEIADRERRLMAFVVDPNAPPPGTEMDGTVAEASLDARLRAQNFSY